MAAPKLLMIHGLLSSHKEFSLMQFPLRRLGIELDSLQVPGYTAEMLAKPGRWQDWLDAAGKALDERSSEAQPVILGGLCTGAVLATALALSRPKQVAGLVLLSPVLAYDGWGLPRWYRLRKLAYVLRLTRWFSMPEREPYGIKNQKLRNWVIGQLQKAGASAVGPARIPLWAVKQSELLSAHVLPRLTELVAPVLGLHAREDEVCSLAAVQRALAVLPEQQLRMIVLEDSYHMITIDNDRGTVVDEVSRFVMKSGLWPLPAAKSVALAG